MNIRYIDTNSPVVRIYYFEDLQNNNLLEGDYINNKKHYLSKNGIFYGVSLNTPSFLNYKNINLIRQNDFGYGYRSECQTSELELIINIITIECKNTKDSIESKYDKKFNDLFENTSDIIKELKQDLDKKNEKLRELELKVHYLESQIEKKVTIDYEAIKKRNKNLNNEFKRVAKLMKLG